MLKINSFIDITEEEYGLIECMAIIILNNLGLNHSRFSINVNTDEEMEDSSGLCYSENEIDISYSKSPEELFKIMAHEMRHAWQYHNPDFIHDTGNTSYADSPYEIDAYEYQDKAFRTLYKN